MKQQTVKRSRNTMPDKHNQRYGDNRQSSKEDFNMLNFYVFSACCCPFIPIVDYSFAIDQLINVVKKLEQWRLNRTNIYQKTNK